MRHRGFTLIELLVTIAVIVIMATIAVPGFQGTMARNQLASDYNEILSGLHFARSEAIKRRKEVTFIPKSHSYSVEQGSSVLRTRNGFKSAISHGGGSGVAIEVDFNRLGRIVESSDCFSGCTLTISYGSGDSKTIEISRFGRVGRGDS